MSASLNNGFLQEFDVSGVGIKMIGNDSVDNTGAKRVWDAAVVLAAYFTGGKGGGKGKKTDVKGKKIIELGSGLGYLASVMAMQGADVLATEMEEMLPLLARNTSIAISTARGEGKTSVKEVSVARLDWTTHTDDIPKLPFTPPYDIILATDVIYLEEYLPPFLDTVSALLRTSPSASIYVCVDVRNENTLAQFHKSLVDDLCLTVKTIPHKKLPPPYNGPDWQHATILLGKLKASARLSQVS
eukprot:TRINITY_DN23095_c0_g1_i1.p1 TRINITY_DN23095_c0_g1~~TRINITY_DN23095_c0_g1_i1.p1  ORF type:complete len:253 (+),score=46.85 TRINITY_DN23095_c0_g1_i1:31-759(+)